jgi:hypothetical protein
MLRKLSRPSTVCRPRPARSPPPPLFPASGPTTPHAMGRHATPRRVTCTPPHTPGFSSCAARSGGRLPSAPLWGAGGLPRRPAGQLHAAWEGSLHDMMLPGSSLPPRLGARQLDHPRLCPARRLRVRPLPIGARLPARPPALVEASPLPAQPRPFVCPRPPAHLLACRPSGGVPALRLVRFLHISRLAGLPPRTPPGCCVRPSSRAVLQGFVTPPRRLTTF